MVPGRSTRGDRDDRHESSQDIPARRARRSAGRGRRRRGVGHDPGRRWHALSRDRDRARGADAGCVPRRRRAHVPHGRRRTDARRIEDCTRAGLGRGRATRRPRRPLAREQGERRRPRAGRVRSMPAAVARVRSRDQAERRRRGGSQGPGRDPSPAQRPAHVATDARSRLERTTPRGAQVAGVGVGRGARRRRPARRARARGRAAPGRASRCRRAAAGPAANGTLEGS